MAQEVMVAVEEKRSSLEMGPVHDAPLLTEYRPFSRAALVALPLALFSLMALISPLLWLLPIVAVVVSLVGVRNTRTGDNRMLGGTISIMALIVSMFVLGYAPAQYITSRALICRQARQYADEWMGLVRDGKLHEAHQLHLVYLQRVAPDVDLNEHYEPRYPEEGVQLRQQIGAQDAYTELQRFFHSTPLKEMVEAGGNGRYEVQYVSIIADESKGKATIVELQYAFSYPENGGQSSMPVRIRMRRSELQNGRKHWNLERIAKPSPGV